MKGLESGRVRYLSDPAPVNMSDDWYEVAPLSHFWIQRRFQALRRLADGLIAGAHRMAEIGCGHGVMQRLIEDTYDKDVTGFDLNALPLMQSMSRRSNVCCYDILQKNLEYKGAFDVIVLFDVLEHIQDEEGFLDAVRFHLAPGGRLIVNVPAFQRLWSRYDVVVGHMRRYDIHQLRSVAAKNGMLVRDWTYWGLPLIPLLLARKVWLRLCAKDKVISGGFSVAGPTMNRILLGLSRLESLPQNFCGTSLMAVLENRD